MRSSWQEIWGEQMDRYLEELTNLVLVALNDKLEICDCNQGFLQLMDLAEKPLGQSLADFLVPEAKPLPELPPVGASLPLRLPFQPRKSTVHLLVCRLFNTGRHYLLVGERLLIQESSLVTKISQLNQELANLARELRQKNRELQEALGQVKTLHGLLPICSACKKIRTDQGYWQQIETYIREHSEADFTHSICPECLKKLYGDFLTQANDKSS